MVEPDILETRIRSQLDGTTVIEIEDLTGTKDHYRAVIVSEAFVGKSRVQQHQAVYGALGELMAGPVHALSLATYTPDAWKSANERG
ncbi:MAG: BolA family protein [Sandaracinaceae bacterium]